MTRQNSAPAFKAPDGRIWFATPAGLAVVNPRAGATNAVPPLVHVEEASVSGLRVPMTGALSITPNPERLEFRYTATGLRVPERMRLQYQLQGADRDWVEGSATRTATYTQLRPGNYRFRVRAWNEDGVPSPSEASVAVRVMPTWYQTWWFRLGLVLALLGAGAGTLAAWLRARARVKVERLRAAFDAALAERTRLARDLHDTLLQGFTGITLQLQAARHSLFHAPGEADATLARVLDLADVTLRDARLMVWDMRAPELDHQELPQALESAAHTCIAGLDIDLDFVVAGSHRRLSLSTETAALRIAREAVVNAVKHASPSRIAIHLAYEDRLLRLSVRDDGPGFAPGAESAASNGGHWGIKGMRERASRAGGTLEITGAAGDGTTLALSLPTE
jgi:signal transduction histidine kinase